MDDDLHGMGDQGPEIKNTVSGFRRMCSKFGHAALLLIPLPIVIAVLLFASPITFQIVVRRSCGRPMPNAPEMQGRVRFRHGSARAG